MGIATGRLVDVAGAPVVGARVAFTPAHGDGARPQTNADGAFATKVLPAGVYTWTIAHSPFARRSGQVELPDGDIRVDLDIIRLAPPSRISGRVVASGGAPVAAASVDAVDGRGERFGPVETGADGTFALEDLVPEKYEIHVTPPPGFEVPAPVVVVLDENGSPGEASFALATSNPGSIAGLVADAAGNPLPGVAVTVTDAGGQVVGTATTAADGRYGVAGLAAGDYSIAVAPPPGLRVPAARTATVAAGAETGAMDFGLEAVRRGVVRGRVTDASGAASAGATLRAEDRARRTADATAAADGTYAFLDLAPAMYTVRVIAPEGYTPAANVRVTEGAPAEGIDFSIDPVRDYFGRIDDARFSIESPISVDEAREGVTLFSVAAMMLAGQTRNGRVDILGVLKLHQGLQDPAFLDRLKVPQSATFWSTLTPRIQELFRILDQRQSEVGQLAAEAKRQFNLGPSNGVLANVAFPALFRRYVEIGADPLLTLNLKAEAQAANADRTKLVQADKLLEELKGVILRLVRSLSQYGTVGTSQLNREWARFETRALEVLATLAQFRVDPGDIDSLSQWAVLADVTGANRETDIAPYVALARHGYRLLDIAIQIYQKTENELERYDVDYLRNLFQEGPDVPAFQTTRIAREATIVNRYPVRAWWTQ